MIKKIIAIFFALALSGCGPEEPVALPEGSIEERIKALSNDVTAVSEVGDSLAITHYQQSFSSGHDWVFSFFEDAKTVLSRVDEASRNKPYRQVVFMVKFPARDNLGHEFDLLGMKVFYDKSKFNGANWKNMTTFDLMELPVDIEFKGNGSSLAAEYCKDSDVVKYSMKFCSRVLVELSRQ